MCGIAGYVGTRTIAPERRAACLTAMGRRGPDHAAERHWTSPTGRHVYLLHTRLAIIDLDPRANQPFTIGERTIASNAELYNYRELRDAMSARGATFRTQSDTEVLLSALATWGWDALDRCEGMWAFAVYDEADGSLTLCRDRFGEKPLYLFRAKSGLYFGSEVKFIVALLGRRLAVNVDHLHRYLVNGYKALYKTRATFFEGLEELPPASFLRVDALGHEERRVYWTPQCAPDKTMSYDEAVKGTRERLVRAVELRLRADVPLAFCMSGGVDSNALIGIARNCFGHDVHGFTIVDSDARYDEQDLVDHAVAELGIRHTTVRTEPRDFLSELRTLVRHHDAPVYTVTYFAHWRLMESIAAAGYRIAVSGTASDELFTGYYDHHLFYLYEIRNDPQLHATARQAWLERVRPIVRNPYLKDPDVFIRNPGQRDHIFLNAEEFAGCLRQRWTEPFVEARLTDGLLRNRMLNEMFHESVPVILHEDDLNAMYFSIENRSPYLDRELFEFAHRIPARHLIQNGLAKAVLRDAMSGIVPERILRNPRKVGFNAPIYSFLDVNDPAVQADLLRDSPVFEHVRRDKVAAMLAKPDLPNSESKFLFYFLSTKMFLEEFAS